MEILGKTRKIIVLLLALLGMFTYFLPVIVVSVPIIGRWEWSALNITSQMTTTNPAHERNPSFGDLANNLPRIATNENPSSSNRDVPLGFTLAPLIPVEILVTYLLLVPVLACLLVPRIQNILGSIAVVGTVSSGAALVSMFFFGDALQQKFSAEMNTPAMRDNPFAAIGQAFVKSVRVESGVALYVLVAVMVGLTLVCQFSWLDRLAVVNDAAKHASAGQ